MIWVAVASLLTWLYLTFAHGRFWQAGPVLPPAVAEAEWPAVCVVVPARDEAGLIGRSIGSLLAQDYPNFSVVLVDDDSGDGTAAIARALPGGNRLRVISGTPRPEGWAGKLWAVSQGVAAADAPLLLLTDADIEHAPGHLASLVARQRAGGFDMVSEMVRLNCESLAERALIPAFVYLFALLYPFARVNDPRSPVAAAAGGTVLIRRTALDRIGGIAAIRGALIDDVALAAEVKPGGPIWLGHSALAQSIRPYGWGDIWRMVTRSAYVQLHRSPLLVLLSVLGMTWLFVVPYALSVAPSLGELGRSMGVFGWLVALYTWAMSLSSYFPTLRRFGLWPFWSLLLPPIALFYMAATVGSALQHHFGRGVVWKRRAYAESRT